jgi:superfamily II DNA/RNA helicase
MFNRMNLSAPLLKALMKMGTIQPTTLQQQVIPVIIEGKDVFGCAQAETTIHRIGRTGRAGMQGTAISFCSGDEMPYLRAIQKLIRKNIPVINHPYIA